MKRIATLLILFSFSVMAVFGFAMMTYTMAGDTGMGCFAGLVGGEECPLGATDIAIHHIAAYQMFSSSPIPLGIGLVGMLLLSVLFTSWFAPLSALEHLHKRILMLRHVYRDRYVLSFSAFLRWLALLEFSPSI